MLHREHILVSDDASRWQGLHELRSTIARDFLHHLPPPTIATTVRHLWNISQQEMPHESSKHMLG